jgi:predicted anti-sigma-YlaC factor YlaD
MFCAEMEAAILEYPELDISAQARIRAHASQCSDCRELLDASMELDRQLSAAVAAPKSLQRKMLAKLERRPSYLPELFDFVGWAAMITVAVGLIREFLATSQN